MKRSLAIAALLVVGLAGCAPTAEIAIPDPPAVEPTPTPTPTQAQETGETRPAAVFDGSCDAVFGGDVVAETFGADITWEDNYPYLSGDVILFHQRRGVTCDARLGDSGTTAQLAVIDASLVDPVNAKLKCVRGGLEWGPHHACFIEAEENGFRLSGVVTFGSGSISESTSKAQALVDGFATQAAGAVVPPPIIPADDAWALPVDCTAVDAAFDAEKALGITKADVYGRGGGDVFDPPAIIELAGGYEEKANTCTWYGDLNAAQEAAGGFYGISTYSVGGGAWALEDVISNYQTEDIAIDGADRAVFVTVSKFNTYLWMTSGSNLLTVRWTGDNDPEFLYPGVAALITAINSTN